NRRHHCRDQHGVSLEPNAPLKHRVLKQPQRRRKPKTFSLPAFHLGSLDHFIGWLAFLRPALRMLDERQLKTKIGNVVLESPECVSVIRDHSDAVVAVVFNERLRHMPEVDALATRRMDESLSSPYRIWDFVLVRSRVHRVAWRPCLDPDIECGLYRTHRLAIFTNNRNLYVAGFHHEGCRSDVPALRQ